MTDYTHLSNLIQGAVLQVRERRPIEDQAALLDDLQSFLMQEYMEINHAKADVTAALRAPGVDSA